jgi:hypothetical protein
MLYIVNRPTTGGHRAVRVNRRSREALMGRLLEEETREIRAEMRRAGIL